MPHQLSGGLFNRSCSFLFLCPDDFFCQLEHGSHVRKLMPCYVQIFSSLDQTVFGGKHLLGNVYSTRVWRQLAIKIIGLLHGDLSFAREKPVDEHPRGVRMGRAFDKADRTAAGAQRLSFFPIPRFKILHGQSLTGGLLNLSATVADGELPHRQPVGDRAPIGESDFHRAQGALDKLRSEVGLVVIELQVNAESGLGGSLRGDFPFPSWIRQVPIRIKYNAGR
jgi:hypothetical protein